ncbi:zinc finger protein ubi-d4-like isoform X2 [Artemia franciscana]|uniref:zinc finger protein ubi-d4-like isoform X2 n=1 Tax=Artemia franciscana TaxID=6661 RepID=UPI0032DA957C
MASTVDSMWSDITVNKELVSKLEKFINSDQAYIDVIRNSSVFNTRLAEDRKMRLPYYDVQTGVAQHCTSLWMSSRQRMPGQKEGQIYTYPTKPWMKRRRQYLVAPPKKELLDEEEAGMAMSHEDSRDTTIGKEDTISKEPWFFDENEDVLDFEEPEPESDDDYADTAKPKRRRRIVAPVKAPKREGRARRKGPTHASTDPLTDADKPYLCALCPARYKTRPGLTYHYAHSHKDQPRPPIENPLIVPPPELDHEESNSPMDFEEAGRNYYKLGRGGRSRPSPALATRVPSPQVENTKRRAAAISPPRINPPSPPPPTLIPQVQTPTPVLPAAPTPPAVSQTPSPIKEPLAEAPRAAPSPFCDFCLGDVANNKKTGNSEELVSCADCGRSGHPSCLQFTANMMVSVLKYRWQCIECKCCSLCGTSDNDLLFCDDCDRGYHMYCLKPPLSEPPEGSWSCHLCVREFHK